MIFEGSCDIEDWSNDAKKIIFPITGIVILFNNAVLLYFLSNKWSLSEYKRLLSKILPKFYWPQILNHSPYLLYNWMENEGQRHSLNFIQV